MSEDKPKQKKRINAHELNTERGYPEAKVILEGDKLEKATLADRTKPGTLVVTKKPLHHDQKKSATRKIQHN